MKFKLKSALTFILVICSISITAYAKQYAWLTDYTDKAYKLDIDTLKINQSINIVKSMLPSSVTQDADNFVDASSNSLFVIYDYPGRGSGQGIRVLNLKDLSLKRELGITSLDPNLTLPKIIIPPIGTKFYLVWWDRSKEINRAGGETYSIYDKNTLNKLSDMTSFPFDLTLPRMFSADGTRLWVLNMDANEIKTYNSETLGLMETVSISNIWGSPLYSKSYENDKLPQGDNLLFCENLKSSEIAPNNIKCFVYNIRSKNLSNKITIVEVSNKYLTPDGSKIITNEISYRRRGTTISGINHLNKVHIYGVSSGQQLKYLDFSNTYSGLDVSTISPDGKKLFLVGKNIQTNKTTTIIVDLISYSIVAQIPVDASFEAFFEDQ